jgi:hypothetical protein
VPRIHWCTLMYANTVWSIQCIVKKKLVSISRPFMPDESCVGASTALSWWYTCL